MLISNDEQQLKSVADRISHEYNVKTRIVVADFTKDNFHQIIKPEVEQLSTIACLVNNVGMQLPLTFFAGQIDSPNEQSITNIIHCNALSTATMTHLVLPKMLTQNGSNPGIINIASYSALRTTPYLAMYTATKAFIIQFAKCLTAEKYTKNDIIIQTLCPLIVYTKMTSNEKLSILNPTAKQFAKSALDMFGVVQLTTGSIRHELKAYLFNLLPTPVWILLTESRIMTSGVNCIIENWWSLFQTLIVSWIIFKLLQLLTIYLKYTVGIYYFSKRKSLRKAGEWAIVTGASAGIGEAYAEELASEGLNLMLISNDEQQLQSVADRISREYNVKTRIVVADFTKDDFPKIIKPEIDKLTTIACLVNNVGMILPYGLFAGEIESPDEQSIRNIIHCNTLSTTLMTSIVLPKMLTQNGESNPGIINIGSYTGCKAFPFISMYSATKAFIIQFSKCLAAEKYPKKIIIQTLYPLFISTKLVNYVKTSYFTPTPRVFAKSALDMFGVEAITCGYFPHELKALVYNLIPTTLWVKLIERLFDPKRQKHHNKNNSKAD
ncbi:unnamed protein product [Schistosoma turkestanicum]|nr:unnamed protein product [Schistosoma turkestanicum]